jgi:hypothetical protein
MARTDFQNVEGAQLPNHTQRVILLVGAMADSSLPTVKPFTTARHNGSVR